MSHQTPRRAGRIELRHGAGGRATAQLIEELFRHHLGNAILNAGDDGAILEAPGGGATQTRWVLATDAFVVSPLFFPGGSIGDLAVNGTVNDLAMMGAVPRYLTAAFILEEGLALEVLDQIVEDMALAAQKAGVQVVAGDTKVVERGKGDGLFISTTGLGMLPPGAMPSGRGARPGDRILISGTLGDHALALLRARNPETFRADFFSDTAPLHALVAELQKTAGDHLHVLRDPTRGGLGNTLNEIAQQSGVGLIINESSLPIRPAVAAATELLGLDPLYLANEGKLILMTDSAHAEDCLGTLKSHALGREARLIGEVVASARPCVILRTQLGGERLIDWLAGDPLPRIC